MRQPSRQHIMRQPSRQHIMRQPSRLINENAPTAAPIDSIDTVLNTEE
jgi:hypothetical protein